MVRGVAGTSLQLGGGGERLAGAEVPGELFDEELPLVGGVFLPLLSGDADAIAGFDGGCVSDERVGLLVGFILKLKAGRGGGSAAGEGGGPPSKKVDADAEGGANGNDANHDGCDLSPGRADGELCVSGSRDQEDGCTHEENHETKA